MRWQRTLTIPAVLGSAAASALVSGGLLAGPAAAAPATPAAPALKSTTVTLALSAARVPAGHEQDETLTVTVRSSAGGTPGGTVVIRAGAAVICAPTLAGGQATCTLPASLLPPGSYQLTASYDGDATFDGSTSGSKGLTITSDQARTPPSGSTGQESYREPAEVTPA
jgi:hypothetical protein